MTAASTDIDSATAIRRVNDTLRGPVADVVSQFLPELRGLPRGKVYDRALDDLDLLSRCFEVFQRERKQFRYIVVDGRHRPVTGDDVPLSCGRTLQQVVAMVVRTAAKRYFRRTLDPAAAKAAPRRSAAQLRQPVAVRRPKVASAADDLYEAIKDYLVHDWQVPLVPAYADMSPGLVRTLGARLLTIRRVEELRRLIADPAAVDQLLAELDAAAAVELVAAATPLADLCARLLSADGRRLRPEAFNEALLRPEVRSQLPQADTVVRVNEVLRDVGGVPARLLLTGLRLTTEQLVVVIFNARHAVGPEVFLRLFGQPGKPELVLRVVERGIASGIGPETPLAECAAFVRRLFTRAAAGRVG
jgi:hypothetical protein